MTDFPYTLVSADSHIVEPPNLWVERIDKKCRDRAPHTVKSHDGQEGEFFVAEGLRPWVVARQFAAGIRGEDMPGYVKNTFAAAPPSVWELRHRRPASRRREGSVLMPAPGGRGRSRETIGRAIEGREDG